MNTKFVLVSSAIFLGVLGLSLSFLPAEIAQGFTINTALPFLWPLQLMGALYFAFAMVNWVAKGAAIGGIYNRPVAIGNFTHFTIGALALLKSVASNHQMSPLILVLTGFYCGYAVLFGLIFFGNGLPR